MPRSKMLTIGIVAAALGVGSAWTLLGVLPQRTLPSVPAAIAVEAPAPSTAPVEISPQKLIRIDGERSELRLEGKDTGLHADKDAVRLRTAIGKFELRW